MPHFYQVVFQMEGIIFTVQNKWSGVFLVGLLFLSLTYKTNDSILMWKIQTEDKIDGQDIVLIQGFYVMRKTTWSIKTHFDSEVNNPKGFSNNKGFGFGSASRTPSGGSAAVEGVRQIQMRPPSEMSKASCDASEAKIVFLSSPQMSSRVFARPAWSPIKSK